MLISFDLTAYLAQKREIVNEWLAGLWDSSYPDPSGLVKAMTYSLMIGGKRLRPILCVASVEAVGGTAEIARPAACALELIHTYSLIHDDLPALDNDDLRRGKPTNHKVFGEATAILAGDALLTEAFALIARAGYIAKPENALQWVEVAHILATAAGHRGMIQGQMLDLQAEGKGISLEQVETLHRLKTGALIEASVRIGALLGQGSKEEIDALSTFGWNIGLAFQVYDDILNIEGRAEQLGKQARSDIARKKATYPILMGVDKARQKGILLIEQAVQNIECLGRSAEPLKAIANYIATRDH
ncbi:MAG: farnesyl diphosphate synthase [Pseudomonadota bacterium]